MSNVLRTGCSSFIGIHSTSVVISSLCTWLLHAKVKSALKSLHPNKTKAIPSSKKGTAIVFEDHQGIIFIDYLKKCWTITSLLNHLKTNLQANLFLHHDNVVAYFSAVVGPNRWSRIPTYSTPYYEKMTDERIVFSKRDVNLETIAFSENGSILLFGAIKTEAASDELYNFMRRICLEK